ncbi:hypothetical protein GCM10009854_18460 [Saccharopolyspora halophila]|uniref:Uncharacterized protein n=1 Tax=Saccharopolyspora halophila TaxID=405551 RepID=A0ABN3G1G9_9PSEU
MSVNAPAMPLDREMIVVAAAESSSVALRVRVSSAADICAAPAPIAANATKIVKPLGAVRDSTIAADVDAVAGAVGSMGSVMVASLP